jgi:hypothetical protein
VLSVREGTTTPPAPKPKRQSATGDRVVGELVNATSGAKPTAEKQAAARSGQLDGGGGGGGIPGATWGLLATVGLFGAGALVEARSLLR